MKQKRGAFEYTAGRLAIKSNLTPDDAQKLKSKIEILDDLITDSINIEQQSGKHFFLMRDY